MFFYNMLCKMLKETLHTNIKIELFFWGYSQLEQLSRVKFKTYQLNELKFYEDVKPSILFNAFRKKRHEKK